MRCSGSRSTLREGRPRRVRGDGRCGRRGRHRREEGARRPALSAASNGSAAGRSSPGPHHFNGGDALAYARIRKSSGESDLTRAARQQEVLVALRDRAVGAGILFSLPSLLPAVGATVRTDLPPDRLPELAALAEQIGGASTTKVVLGSPLIRSGGSTQFGSIFVPVPAKIRAMAKVVFGPPGADPSWPVPVPGAAAPSAQGPTAP